MNKNQQQQKSYARALFEENQWFVQQHLLFSFLKKWQFPNILKSLPSYAYMNHARWNWYKSAIITKRSSWKLCGLRHEYFLLSEQYTELWPRCLLLKFCFFFFFFSPLLLGCAIVMRDMMQLQFLSITETVLFFSYSALLIITQSYNVSRV